MHHTLSVLTAPGVRSSRLLIKLAYHSYLDPGCHAGITRKQIGATFEGQTKDLDGHVWADVYVDGLSTEVS